VPTLDQTIPAILEKLHIEPINSGACYGDWIPDPSGGELESLSPATGEPIAKVQLASLADYECVMTRAAEAFPDWRMVPAPQRGEIVREIANELRLRKAELGALVSLEMGKILAEGLGEVQEMIDVADFAVGLSRQLYGLTMHSERPGHRMYEQWHPLGIVGVISAFNFPVAVWSWNAMIAAVCGDCVLWRPSSEPPLAAIAVQKICNRVLDRHNLKGVFNLAIGPADPIGAALVNDRRIAENTARIPHPYGIADAKEWIGAVNAQSAETYLITIGGETVGACGLDIRGGVPEIGYWLGVPFWGCGYATEAARAVIDHAFGDLGHEVLTAGARISNPASRRVLEKCAFQWTGVRLTRIRAINSAAPVDRFRLDRGLWRSLKAWGRVRRVA